MQQALDLPISPRYGFDSFIPCPGNATALEFARRVADPAGNEKLLYLYGDTGSGKTHLLHSIGRSLSGDGYQVVSCRDLALLDEADLLNRLQELPALLVDDLDQLPMRLRVGMWELFNRHHQAGRTVVLAGRPAPKELQNLDDHLISRLLWGLVARMDVSDDRSRLMLIGKLAADRQIVLPEEVASWLLTVLPRDVGSLVTACNSLYRAALEQQRRITLRLARELFTGQP